MATTLKWDVTSGSAETTESIGAQVGARLKGGEVIELVSDLGGGKTTFVRGLARGLGSSNRVASPTFTISREYKAGNLTLQHFDFYRLNQAGVVANELGELLGDPLVVIVIEWVDVVKSVLPAKRLRVHFTPRSETTRELTFTYPAALDYLISKER